MNWLSHIFGRREFYGDLAEEMRLHLEEQTARRAFGNSTLLEERSRGSVRGTRQLSPGSPCRGGEPRGSSQG